MAYNKPPVKAIAIYTGISDKFLVNYHTKSVVKTAFAVCMLKVIDTIELF
jgi:hypothetical protein